MSDDADTAGQARAGARADPSVPTASAACPGTTRTRTDRQSAGRSVETTPESLYLWQIAVLEARVDDLEREVATREQNLQHVIDRYEHVLDDRSPDDELRADGGRTRHPSATTPGTDAAVADRPDESPDGLVSRVLARARSLVR